MCNIENHDYAYREQRANGDVHISQPNCGSGPELEDYDQCEMFLCLPVCEVDAFRLFTMYILPVVRTEGSLDTRRRPQSLKLYEHSSHISSYRHEVKVIRSC